MWEGGGLAGLWLAAFLAATPVPFQSEVVFVALQAAGVASPLMLVIVASVGNVLGSVVTYAIGRGVSQFQARRWFPSEHHSKVIVIDPARQFGKPMLTESAVPTRALYASYKAEGADKAAAAMVARLFELPVKDVQAAVKFEADLQFA